MLSARFVGAALAEVGRLLAADLGDGALLGGPGCTHSDQSHSAQISRGWSGLDHSAQYATLLLLLLLLLLA